MLLGLWTTAHEKNIAFKRAERHERIDALPEYHEPISAAEQTLLNKPAEQVVGQVQNGEIKPRDVLKAYGKQALRAHFSTNCLTEIMIKDAESWAEAADRQGPLAGFPISMKDTVAVSGYDSTIGMSKFVGKKMVADSPLVRLLRDAGAYPFVKTNIPFTLLSFESYNDIWGTTDNPHVTGYSPGGSSGGESALLAYGGSRLGIGTDVAGSVRLPAHFSGCYALRCSTQRFPKAGNPTPMAGQEGIPSVYSPMTRTLGDLSFFLKSIISMKPWEYDYTCIDIPWREPELPTKLKIGVMWTDDVVTPSPACRRALELTVDALEKKGHEIVNFKCPRPLDALRVASHLLMSDAAKVATSGIHFGEHNDVGVQRALNYQRLPWIFRKIYTWYVRYIRRDPVWADLLSSFKEQSITDRWALVYEREAYKNEFFEQWKGSGIDILLTVPNATPAFPHRGLYNSFSSCGYTFLFNLLDYSAGVLPVTKVDRAQDALPSNFRFSELNGVAQGAYLNYDVDRMHGLPVGVQVVGLRLEEEKVLKVMHLAEDALTANGTTYELLHTTAEPE